MSYQNAPDEYEYDDYDEYDEYDETDPYADEGQSVDHPGVRRASSVRRAAKRREIVSEQNVTARRAIDWGTTGGIVMIILLTLLYAFSPIDAIPDVVPIAGQADDVVAVTAGTATAGVLAFLRIALRAMLASRIGRKGCVILAGVMGIVTILAFVGLASLIGSIV